MSTFPQESGADVPRLGVVRLQVSAVAECCSDEEPGVDEGIAAWVGHCSHGDDDRVSAAREQTRGRVTPAPTGDCGIMVGLAPADTSLSPLEQRAARGIGRAVVDWEDPGEVGQLP